GKGSHLNNRNALFNTLHSAFPAPACFPSI
ncbi:MAG: hypothetical protein ACI9HK_005731, partial [Pirellulaceae bacterium]